MIFVQSAMVAMLFLKMSTIIFYRYVVTAINILCNSGEDIFTTEQDIKCARAKQGVTNPIGFHGVNKTVFVRTGIVHVNIYQSWTDW